MSSSPNAFPSSTFSSNASYMALVATLVLLLAVSSAIVIRSLILRRRHQRLVEEAIRTGTWMPQRFNSSRRRRDIGQKPSLWEVWLNTKDHDGEAEQTERRYWGDIMPVYAAYIDPPASSPPQGPSPSSTETAVQPMPRPARFLRPFIWRRSPPSPQPTALSPMASQELSSSPSSPTTSSTTSVRVAVLIAMPNPSKNHGASCGLPVVEFGVVQVDVMDDEMEPPSHASS